MIYPLLLLVAVEFCSFGIFAPRLGFYHDDWYFLELMSRGGGLWGMIKAMAGAGQFWTRPLELLEFPFLYLLGGFNPLIYQEALLALEITQGFLFFLLLGRLTGRKELSLAAAALAMMCPNRAVTHVWFSNIPQSISIVLALSSLISHWDWIKTKDRVALAVGQAAYLLSALSYESCVFLPLLLLGAEAAGRKSLRHAARDMLPYAATLGAVIVWQRLAVPVLLGAANPKTLGFSAAHFFKAFGAGFECVTNRILDACWRARGAVWNDFGGALRFFLGLFTGAAAGMMPFEKPEAPRQVKTALGAALGGFIGAYLPYALSASYMPQIYGLMSRTNGTGALVAGLLLATGICAIKRYRPRRLALFAVVGAFTWTNWKSQRQYEQSWSIQQDILGKIRAKAAVLPSGAQVLLSGAPGFVGPAVVFDASWDFGPALRLLSGRADLVGDVWSSAKRYDREGVIDESEGRRLIPYGNLYVYDYSRDALDRAAPPGL